jgi:hypothetical protein
MEAFERERVAFERMKPELLRTHRGKVVAIYQGQVVQVGTDIAETLDAVYNQFGYVPCYVQRVEETPHVYKISRSICASPRDLRDAIDETFGEKIGATGSDAPAYQGSRSNKVSCCGPSGSLGSYRTGTPVVWSSPPNLLMVFIT